MRKRFTFVKVDTDKERKTHAEVLINTYNRELERTRTAASSQGIFVTSDGASYASIPQHTLSPLLPAP